MNLIIKALALLHTVTVAPTPGPVKSLLPVISTTPASSPAELDVGAIVGIILAVTAAIIAIIVSIYCIRRESQTVPPVHDVEAMVGEEDSYSFSYRKAASIKDALKFANPTLGDYKDKNQNSLLGRGIGKETFKQDLIDVLRGKGIDVNELMKNLAYDGVTNREDVSNIKFNAETFKSTFPFVQLLQPIPKKLIEDYFESLKKAAPLEISKTEGISNNVESDAAIGNQTAESHAEIDMLAIQLQWIDEYDSTEGAVLND